jgi:dihydropteroate synthase
MVPALPVPQTLNCRGRLLSLEEPLVMGILNLTPDSFSDGGRYQQQDAAIAHTEAMLAAGATIIDIGAYSSRPGAPKVSEAAELERLAIVPQLVARFPEAIFSVDTFRANVAVAMLAAGVHILNDITAGLAEPAILRVAAENSAPMILMHMQGTPQTMQQNPTYTYVVAEVMAFLQQAVARAHAAGVHDVVLDPGFGFGKSLAHNYALVAAMPQLQLLGRPLLMGISRKRMLTQGLDLPQPLALHAAGALHYQALCQGVRILRVHDVPEAVAICRLFAQTTHGAL